MYLVPMLLIWVAYFGIKLLRSRRNVKIMDEEYEAGLTEPVSLHPIIDNHCCMGCAACVAACPEQNNHPVLGIIKGRAELIAPTNCIGHGACKRACPFDAITLVFGTERRGVDIPVVSPDFETNMPGIFIAGELGGMGLIRNAIEQGYKALDSLHKGITKAGHGIHDVLIVGAGPAGFSATLRAHELNLDYITVEQDSLGGTVFQFPRGKMVMTAPVELPIIGKVKLTETSKESLLSFWEEIEIKTGIRINYKERVQSVVPIEGGYQVDTSRGSYRTQSILLAIGRRGTPRKLGVPGEELGKVVYRLIDPEQFRNQHVLIVGGGDSALEAAVSLSDQPGTKVTLSYRSGAFSRAKKKNRHRIDKAVETGKIQLLLNSNVSLFDEDTVTIEQDGKRLVIENDAAIISAGGVLPTGFLSEIGIAMETKHGTA